MDFHLRALTALLAGAILASAAIPLTLNSPHQGSLAFLGDEEHFTYSVPTSQSEQGLIIKTSWPAGNVHIYARCDERPGLRSGSYWQRAVVGVDAKSNDLFLPDVRSCVSPKTLHIVAYGFRKTTTYSIVASHSTTELQPHVHVSTAALDRNEWVYYQASLEMVSRLMISAKLLGATSTAGVYISYKKDSLPTVGSYGKRTNVYKTSAVRCLEVTTPEDGLYYIGIQGELARSRLEFQLNINPLGSCAFQTRNPGSVVKPPAGDGLRRLSADEVESLRALE